MMYTTMNPVANPHISVSKSKMNPPIVPPTTDNNGTPTVED